MTEVSYDRDSFNRCNCGGCPMQRHSRCVQEQEERLAPLKERIQRDAVMPDPAMMPGVYSASAVGRSSCDGLDEAKPCLCPACTLAIMEGLTGSYYCLKGSAAEVG